MKKIILSVLSLLIIFTAFSASSVTPSGNLIKNGHISVDLFNPSPAIRMGLFGFLETGVSVQEDGAYIKIGFNDIQNIPVYFNAGYSNAFGSSGNFFTTVGYTGNLFEIGGGVGLKQYERAFYSEEDKDYYYGFLKTRVIFRSDEILSNSISFESKINFDTEITKPINYLFTIYGIQTFKKGILFLNNVDVYGGLVFNSDTISLSQINIIKDINIILGITTEFTLF